MSDHPPPKITFIICTTVGLILFLTQWLINGNDMDFFLMLFILCLTSLRLRFPKMRYTAVLDILLCIMLSPAFLGVALFSAMFHGMYFAIFAAIYAFYVGGVSIGIITVLAGGIGFILRKWSEEHTLRLTVRDASAMRYYELESLQGDLVEATAQIERMTAVSERARISREIHDNAGHEIVAAYMSLQTARYLFNDANPDALSLYDAALDRLDVGVNKVREAVHNLGTVAILGVEILQKKCTNFPKDVEFSSFGDTNRVPVHIWNVLESCLNEALTNIAKHASPNKITVELDVAPRIVRLCIENDGVISTRKSTGTGLRNLRHRLNSISGSLSIHSDKIFRVVCVVPIIKQ